MLALRFWLVLGAGLCLVDSAWAADWPHWRGPRRNDLTPETSGWTGKEWVPQKPSWQAKVGIGASSPLVVGDRVYTHGHEEDADVVRCLNLADGKERWAVRFQAPLYGRYHEGDEGIYSGPSSTPEYDAVNNYLYILGVDGDLRCLDLGASGKEVWHRNLYVEYKVGKRPRLTRAPQRDYGYTSSPLVQGDWVVVEVGSTTQGTLIAFAKKTGKEVWASQLKEEAGHTGGPAPMQVQGIPCVAVITQRNLAVIRLDAGKEGQTVATFPWVTDFANTIASPAVFGDSVLLTAAYNHNTLCRVRITLQGAKEVWRADAPSKVCTPVIHEGKIYVAWRRVRCLDWDSGKQDWEGGTWGDPGSCIVTSDGRLIVYGANGKLALVEGAKRSPTAYKELAVVDRLFRTHAWPHVVLANGRVLCRDRAGNLACFPLPR